MTMGRKHRNGWLALLLVAAAGCGSAKSRGQQWLGKLPAAEQVTFRITDLAAVRDNAFMKEQLLPDEQEQWQRTELGRAFSPVGVTRKDLEKARTWITLGRAGKPDTHVLVMNERQVLDVKGRVDTSAFDIRKEVGTRLFVRKSTSMLDTVQYAFAFVGGVIVAGVDGPYLADVMKALAGTFAGKVLLDDPDIRSVWEALPDGMTLTVSAGAAKPRFELEPTAVSISRMDVGTQSFKAVMVMRLSDSVAAHAAESRLDRDIRQLDAEKYVRGVRASGRDLIVYLRGDAQQMPRF